MMGRYFWFSIGGFLFGIAVADMWAFGVALPLLFFALTIAVWASSRSRIAMLCAVMLFAGSIGALRVHIADVRAAGPLDALVGERITLEGRIADEPDRRENSVRITVLPYMGVLVSGGEIELGHAPRILVPVPLPADLSYGDIVRVSGILKAPEAFGDDNGREFDYPSYLAARGIRFEMPFSKVERVEQAGWSLRGVLFDIKNTYLFGLQRALPEPLSSLAGGITVGDKRSLGEKLTDAFRRTGLVHIVVLSGYNITLIVGALMLIVRNAPITWRFVFGGGVIVAFVLMTGASATGVRAGAMAVLALLAAASYRKYAINRALAVTAAGMGLWNPHTLLYDPGFQLSVVATVGLVHIAPVFERRLTWVTEKLQLRSIAAATLGTQAAVLPLLVQKTGMLSLIALPANLLVLPTIPVAMIASFAAGVVGSIYGAMGIIVGIPAHLLLAYSIQATELLAAIPFGAIELPAFSGWFVAAIYALMLLLWRIALQPPSNSDS